MGWANYADVGRVFEISAVFDDHLKKDSDFINYAVMVANRILEDKGFKAQATWGKWGCRIEPLVNPHLSEDQIVFLASVIERHQSWVALKMSTWVFTYGEHNDEVSDYQATNTNKGQDTPLDEIINNALQNTSHEEAKP
jgi:hypothetical protein